MANTLPDATSAQALTRAERVIEAIHRLDCCADRLQAYRSSIGDTLYEGLVSQAYVYASFLTDCKAMGMSLLDPRLREVTREMVQFCDFLE